MNKLPKIHRRFNEKLGVNQIRYEGDDFWQVVK